jgi:hypothetical protein
MRSILILFCLVSHAFAFDWQSKVNSGDFTEESHPGTDPVAETNVRKSGGDVGFIQNGNWIKFSGFDFGTGTSGFWINAAKDNTTNSTLEIRTGSPNGTVMGVVTITDTGDWGNYTRFGVEAVIFSTRELSASISIGLIRRKTSPLTHCHQRVIQVMTL